MFHVLLTIKGLSLFIDNINFDFMVINYLYFWVFLKINYILIIV